MPPQLQPQRKMGELNHCFRRQTFVFDLVRKFSLLCFYMKKREASKGVKKSSSFPFKNIVFKKQQSKTKSSKTLKNLEKIESKNHFRLRPWGLENWKDKGSKEKRENVKLWRSEMLLETEKSLYGKIAWFLFFKLLEFWISGFGFQICI